MFMCITELRVKLGQRVRQVGFSDPRGISVSFSVSFLYIGLQGNSGLPGDKGEKGVQGIFPHFSFSFCSLVSKF